ncbi:Transposon Tf2-11 polyprotein [Vitis vinifera]|uniref:Transposon Tf2-11 polyprotein n=1 Tax=Vitis vinifera TaxID=29760 RepID=A0A438DE37_VITVI|nr:Transposon Tf2-11 polyprotein [Vitis vinifera]
MSRIRKAKLKGKVKQCEMMHGLNETQKKLKQQGYGVKPSRAEVDSNLESSEDEPGEAPQAFEDGGQATIDELKELNLVKKKNGHIHVYVDFRDLNNACPKDDFSLPIIELMVDATTGHEAFSFMDGSSGCNISTCHMKIFADMLHKNVECYVNDLVVKSRKREDHLRGLRMVFDRLKRYQLKMNPLKCAFGVTSSKFLGFIVRHRGIEVDQSKILTIQDMPKLRNLQELRSLQGRLTFIRRFILNLVGKCQPFN